MASHAVRSWSASRRGSPNSRVVQPTELATRSSEEYSQGEYRLLQSGIKLLRSTRRDLEPVAANEEKVVRVLRQPAKVSIRNNVPSENVPEDLGWEESRNVQQRVLGAFVLDYGPLVFFDLLIQRSYGTGVDLPVHRCCETASGVVECLRVSAAHINGDVSSRGIGILS